jgi:hypothetical protein
LGCCERKASEYFSHSGSNSALALCTCMHDIAYMIVIKLQPTTSDDLLIPMITTPFFKELFLTLLLESIFRPENIILYTSDEGCLSLTNGT